MNDSPSVSPHADDVEAAWYSLLQRARALRDSGQDELFVSTALDALHQRPHRAEPLHDLARYYLGKSRGDIAIIYADAGMALPLPEQDRLGVEEDVYRFRLKEAFAIAASYSQDLDEKERVRVICNWLSMNKALPHYTRALARQNSRWYAEPANLLFPSIRFNALSVASAEGFKPGNISLVRVDDEFVALVRAVNYDLLDSGYFDRHGDTSFRQRVLLLRLDANLAIIGSDEVLPPDDLPPPIRVPWSGATSCGVSPTCDSSMKRDAPKWCSLASRRIRKATAYLPIGVFWRPADRLKWRRTGCRRWSEMSCALSIQSILPES